VATAFMLALMDDVVLWRIPSIPLVVSVCALLVPRTGRLRPARLLQHSTPPREVHLVTLDPQIRCLRVEAQSLKSQGPIGACSQSAAIRAAHSKTGNTIQPFR
jgi:hypothetical protein